MQIEELKNIISRYVENYHLFSLEQNKTLLIFLCPYKPFKFNDNDAEIDSYYFASNKAYLIAKKLQNDIGGSIKHTLVLNDYLCRVKGFFRGLNSLSYNEKYGSRFYLGSLLLDFSAPITPTIPMNSITDIDYCIKCGKCIEACPAKAISKDGLDAEKCLRHKMDFYEKDEKILTKYGKKILGCDVCQRVCPHNKMELEEKPEVYRDYFDVKNLIQNSLKGKAGLKELSVGIGENFCRQKKLLYSAINVATNLKDESVRAEISGLVNSPDEDLAFIAKRYLKLW